MSYKYSNDLLLTYPSSYHYSFSEKGALVQDESKEGEDIVLTDAGRYIILTTKECNVSHAALLTLKMLNLEDVIYTEELEKIYHNNQIDWKINHAILKEQTQSNFLSQLCHYHSIRMKLPILYDLKDRRVINESHDLPLLMCLESIKIHNESNVLIQVNNLKLIIDTYLKIKNNIEEPLYNCLFTNDLEVFCTTYNNLFDGLFKLNNYLQNQRFLNGDYVSIADIRFFTILIRFDVMYSRYINPVKNRLWDLEHLWEYARDIYQIPLVYNNSHIDTYIAKRNISEEYKGYWTNTFYDLVLPQMELDSLWKLPTKRTLLSLNPHYKILEV